MIFQYINVCPVPREMLKTSAYGLGFQHLPRDLANVNAWKTMFDPYIDSFDKVQLEKLSYKTKNGDKIEFRKKYRKWPV